MKTRLRLLALLAVLILSFSSITAGNWWPDVIGVFENDDMGVVSRSETELPISAELTSDSFILNVYGVLGNATVTITNSSGQVVHSDFVSFMAPRQYSVSLGNYQAGNYRMMITFTYGIKLVADFTLRE